MKKYQAPQIEVTAFEVEDIVTANNFSLSSFSLENFGGWDRYGDITENNGTSSYSNIGT